MTRGTELDPGGTTSASSYETAPASPQEHASAAAAETPLCVDLDGTLVKSDTLLDAVLLLARQQPTSPLHWPAWLRQGKAGFKREVTARAAIDVEHLPYNLPLLEYLREERMRGRAIYLATAADAVLAERVALHLGIFDGVLASDGQLNLAGRNKLAAFRTRFPNGFTYIGNALPDMPLLEASTLPMVANPVAALQGAMRRGGVEPVRVFQDRRSPLKSFLKAIRVHQWAKNTLVFLPPLLAHERSPNTVVGAVAAFFSLSFCASATYIINDLLDIEADRKHPRKRNRPFAAGDLSPVTGLAIVAGFLAIAVVLGIALPYLFAALPGFQGVREVLPKPFGFLLWLGIYTATTLAYSFRLKRVVLVDVLVLSGLYTIRIIAGSTATGVGISPWLAAFAIFFFLALAFVKRFAELELMVQNNRSKASGRGYHTSDIEQLRSFGTASGYASVVVFTMYISSLNASSLYQHSARLWLLVPLLILWISRTWMLASRGELHEDPVVYAITDRRSWLMGAMCVAIVWSAL